MNEETKVVGKQKQIPCEVDDLMSRAHQVLKLTEVLEGDLCSVTAPANPSIKSEDELMALVPLASSVRDIHFVLDKVFNNLDDILNRLEL